MRLAGHLLFWLGLAGLLAAGGWTAWDAVVDRLSRRGRALPAVVETARTATVYRLAPGEEISFPLQPQADPRLRLLSHAEVAPDLPAPDEAEIRYHLNATFLSTGGHEVGRRRLAFTTRVVRFRDDADGTVFASKSYLGDPTLATATDRSILTVPRGARRLELSMAPGPPPARGAAVRLYQPVIADDAGLDVTWQRMSRAERRRLADGHVYEPDFLTRKEIHNALRNRWAPVGPIGIDGRDYRSATLYTLTEHGGRRLGPAPRPIGQLAGPTLHAVIPVPAPGGRVRLALAPWTQEGAETPAATDPTDVTDVTDETLSVLWYGERLRDRWRGTRVWTAAAPEVTLEVGPGTLDLVPSRPVAIRAYLSPAEPGEDPREITPPPIRLRHYRLATGESLDFPVRHVGTADTLIRIDVRAATPAPSSMTAANEPPEPAAAYRIVSDRGRLIAHGDLPHPSTRSGYDLLEDMPGAPVADRAQHFFRLAAEARWLTLVARRPCLVAVFNRPAGHPVTRRLPEDETGDPDRVLRRTWFVLRPVAHEALVATEAAPLLELRRHPPDDDPDIVAGRYLWEDFQPAGGWRGRRLLTPRAADEPDRPEALAAIFRPLPPTGTVDVVVAGYGPNRFVRPTLLFFAPEGARRHVSVRVGRTRPLVRRVRGPTGMLPLDAIRRGRHRLEVSSTVDRLMINHVAQGLGGPSFLRRLAVEVADRPMVIALDKVTESDEPLLMTYFAPGELAGATRRCGVTVSIGGARTRAPRPLSGLTFRSMAFDLAPGDGAAVPVLGTRGRTVRPGRRVFLPIAADLAPGPLSLELDFAPACRGGTLILSRVLAGRRKRLPVTFDRNDPFTQ